MTIFSEHFRDIEYDYKIEVENCMICPFSQEVISDGGDYIKNKCVINRQNEFDLNKNNELPKLCPLKNRKCLIIKVELKK